MVNAGDNINADVLIQLADPTLLNTSSYIGGKWYDSTSERRIEVSNPADNTLFASVSSMTGEESTQAVQAANEAFPRWSVMLPQERALVLRKWFELLIAHKEDLALIMTLEQGKPLSEARSEIEYGASFIEFFAEQAKRPDIIGVTSHLPNAEMEVWLEPVGVAAMITPWNFPNAMITRKAAAALAVGCTVVVHPSKETPLSALALASLAERAGFPAGVFNVVTGEPAEIVEPWTANPQVRALSFTGSTAIGHLLYQQCGQTIKRLSLELGGHAPYIVFADAKMERAVDEAISAKYATSGQDCLAANCFLIERPVYPEFCERFAKKSQALIVGKGLDDPDIGPLMNTAAINKQEAHVEDALSKGARLLCGGEVLTELGELFYAPTVLADVADDSLIMHEETFGPVAALVPFDTEEEVVAKANATEYGLMAYLHTKDPSRIYRMSRTLQFGMVGVNRTKVTGAPIPFGGVKQSGLGREGSKSGLEAFADMKYVCRDWS